jgi:hypothetical protein
LVLVPIPVTEKSADDSSRVSLVLVGGWLERIPNLSFSERQQQLGKISVEEAVETMKSASMMKGLMLAADDGDDDSRRAAAVMRPSHLGSGSFVVQDDSVEVVETNAPSSNSIIQDRHHHAALAMFASDTLEEWYGSLFASDDFSKADTLLFSDDNEEDDNTGDNSAVQVCVRCVREKKQTWNFWDGNSLPMWFRCFSSLRFPS